MNTDKTPGHIKLDEKNHVEKPLLISLHAESGGYFGACVQ